MTLVGGGGKHSIFAKVFISLLEENTGVLNTTQLFSELQPKVSKNAKQTPRHGKNLTHSSTSTLRLFTLNGLKGTGRDLHCS